MVLNSSNCRVLLVDNDIEACRLMAEILTKNGCAVFCAHDAAAALELIPLYDPEVVFVDFLMADLDGFQLAAQSEKWQMGAALLVALTEFSDAATQMRVKHTGFHMHIVKPERIDTMLLVGNARRGRAALMH